tara:strand:- start:75 stop:281 length:207 start_codon:yes stop_codon:yes gene_type:complete
MLNSTYLYLFFSSLAVFFVLYLFFYFKPGKNDLDNKTLLRNLLQSLDLELPEELKRLDNSSTDTQNFS